MMKNNDGFNRTNVWSQSSLRLLALSVSAIFLSACGEVAHLPFSAGVGATLLISPRLKAGQLQVRLLRLQVQVLRRLRGV